MAALWSELRLRVFLWGIALPHAIALPEHITREVGNRSGQKYKSEHWFCSAEGTPGASALRAAAPAATRPCGGRDRPAHDSPQNPDSPAAFLESCRGHQRYSVAPS